MPPGNIPELNREFEFRENTTAFSRESSIYLNPPISGNFRAVFDGSIRAEDVAAKRKSD